MQETQDSQVRSLGWEDPLEEKMATHFSIFFLENPVDRGICQTTVHRVAESQTQLSTHTHILKYLN